MISLHGGNYTAVINPERGANCISLRNSKYNAVILREPDEEGIRKNPYLYGCPVLYPANRISEGRFEFEGREYSFPVNEPDTGCCLHGFLHETSFDVVCAEENFVKCVFEKPYLGFPHAFRMEIAYKLSDGGMEQRVKITNKSEESMPNFLGFHTTFNVPFTVGGRADDVRLLAEVGDEIERDAKYLPTGMVLANDGVTDKINNGTFVPFEKTVSRNYKAAGSGRIELTDVKKHIKLVYENDEKFGWRMIYNGNADGYICLEPMTCAVNCPNAPFDRAYSGFDSIPPHCSREYLSKIYLKKE